MWKKAVFLILAIALIAAFLSVGAIATSKGMTEMSAKKPPSPLFDGPAVSKGNLSLPGNTVSKGNIHLPEYYVSKGNLQLP